MKKLFITIAFFLLLPVLFSVEARGGNVYEYSMGESGTDDIIPSLYEALPEEVANELPRETLDARDLGFSYFWDKICESLKTGISPLVRTASSLLGAVIVSALFSYLADGCSPGLSRVYSALCALCIALCAYEGLSEVFSSVETMLTLLSGTMTAMIAAMEAVCIAGGNLTSAAVMATGIQLMIGFTEALFASVLSPASQVLFVLGVTASVTGNGGIGYMSRLLRGLITGVLVAAMALFCLTLSLQVSLSQAGDTLAARTVKFAMGSYIPIVGGSVSEVFSYMAAGISVIKQGCGVLGIVAVILAFLPPFAVLLSARVSVGISRALAGMLSLEREGALLEECKAICNLLMAISVGAVAMYIIALGIFCKTAVAVA